MAITDYTEKLVVLTPETTATLQRNTKIADTLITLISGALTEKEFATNVVELSTQIEPEFEKAVELSARLSQIVVLVKENGAEMIDRTTAGLLAIKDTYTHEIETSKRNLDKYERDAERRHQAKKLLDTDGLPELAKDIFLGILTQKAGKIAIELNHKDLNLTDPISILEGVVPLQKQDMSYTTDTDRPLTTTSATPPNDLLDIDRYKQSIIDSGDITQIFRKLFIGRDERQTLDSDEISPNIFPLTLRSHALLGFIIAGKNHQRTTEDISKFLSEKGIIIFQAGVLLHLTRELINTDLVVINKNGVVKIALRTKVGTDIVDYKKKHFFKQPFRGDIQDHAILSIFDGDKVLTATQVFQEFTKLGKGDPSSSKIQQVLENLVKKGELTKSGGKFVNGKAAKYFLKRNVITPDSSTEDSSAPIPEDATENIKLGVMSFVSLFGYTIENAIPEITSGRLTFAEVSTRFEEAGADLNDFLFNKLDQENPIHQKFLDLLTMPQNPPTPTNLQSDNTVLGGTNTSLPTTKIEGNPESVYLEGEVFKTVLGDFIPDDFNKDKKNPKSIIVNVERRKIELKVEFNNGVVKVWESLQEKNLQMKKLKSALRSQIKIIATLPNIGLLAKRYQVNDGLISLDGKTVYMFENKGYNNIQILFTVEELQKGMRRITFLGFSDHHNKKDLLSSLGKSSGIGYKGIST